MGSKIRYDLVLCILALIAYSEQGIAASRMRPPPAGASANAPREFTVFDGSELTSGFMRLAFGSDMQRLGESDDHIHKFDHRIAFRISSSGHIDRSEMYKRVLDDFNVRVPRIEAAVVDTSTAPDVIVRLVDAKNFLSALAAVLGETAATAFINQTNPRCTTRSRVDEHGHVLRADVFIVVDQGTDIFLDCAYHETLHAFGLMNHADDIPWTTLNQNRNVGYLSVYDRGMLQMLYDPKIRAGMSRSEVQILLPQIIKDLD
jgi:Protein of unknown function (DUF2927)